MHDIIKRIDQETKHNGYDLAFGLEVSGLNKYRVYKTHCFQNVYVEQTAEQSSQCTVS